ncbi:drug resistance transporter, EmrB/QacA subfamily [Mesorhizobium albiziae]|uniref:Drug resistance transporter, EmrB/QacA subfamily n=1 Tax=Neomesorhizobium albiziae TaxID=335020 RepID=A0A1I4DZ48_9HYPH|nr:MFS transporter [Mesorhizobium albiziae]GLS31187.1 MFS transporter [Mesorhizobium albiziae]SFK98735.1 drug resistance transporter, EmrB/QacA subfamily [Mesorhizobium albiziae]
MHKSNNNTIALMAVCLAALMFGLEISSVPVILPILEKAMGAGFSELQWIMNAYTIACTTVLMATGTLADRYGRKRIFVISLTVFGVTSLLCGLAENPAVLIVARFLQGMGGGAMLICSIAILSHQFREGGERARGFAVWGVISGIGLGFGPIVGGVIVAATGWPWVFLVHVPLTVLTLLLVLAGVAESRDPEAEKLDIAGIFTLSAAVFGLVYFITQGPELGFASTPALVILVVSVLAFIAFVGAERLSTRPMFDFSVFRIRNFSGAIVGCVGMNFSFWPFMIYLPIYFQVGLGYDAVTTGMSLLAYTLPTLVLPPLAERLSLRYHPRIVIPAGLATIGLGFLLMRYGSNVEGASWLTMLPGNLLAGIGLGVTHTPVTNTTTGSVPGARAGMASGIDMSARLITLAINIAMMGFVLREGILSFLRGALPVGIDAARMQSAAEKIAAGDIASLAQYLPELSSMNTSGAVFHAALVNGFNWVMLYGGVGVLGLAALSLAIFGRAEKVVPQESSAG